MGITAGRRQQRVVPKECQDRLIRAGGLNLYNEPNFRLSWGWSRMDWLYNLKAKTYLRVPKYITRPGRFIVEQWHPAERYGSPESWARTQTEQLDGQTFELCGPYPSRGDYELLLLLENPHMEGCEFVAPNEDGCPNWPCRGGTFLEPTTWVMDQVCKLVERSRDLSARDRFNRVREGMEHWSKDYDSYAEDLIKDHQPTFHTQPTVYLNSPK